MRFLIVVLVLSACTAPEPAALTQEIIGGTDDSGDPSVVIVIAQMPNSMFATLCSGSIVSPHVVLTAAHCVDPTIVGATSVFSVFTGANIDNAGAQSFLPTSATHFNSDFDPNNVNGGNDIAVVIMQDALPSAPLAMNHTPLSNALIGQTARLVGYGQDVASDPKGSSAGVRREVASIMGQFSDKLVEFGGAGANTCEGDSGGPAFMTIDGKEVIVGIVSFGDTSCMEFGTDTRVDVYADSFVAPYIAMADPGFDPGKGPSGHSGCDVVPGARPDAQRRLPLVVVLGLIALLLRRRAIRS